MLNKAFFEFFCLILANYEHYKNILRLQMKIFRHIKDNSIPLSVIFVFVYSNFTLFD